MQCSIEHSRAVSYFDGASSVEALAQVIEGVERILRRARRGGLSARRKPASKGT
jgi:hypothetical protein